MSKVAKVVEDDEKRALADVRALCLTVADHAAKGQWWNAMAYAAELVVVCQNGCHSEIERVADRRRLPAKSGKGGKGPKGGKSKPAAKPARKAKKR